MKPLDPDNGFVMHGWMVNGLGLGGYELVAYAIVYQFSQSNAGQYTGGVPYLAAWLGCQENTARKHLRALESKGLIQSIRGDRGGVPFCHYRVVDTPQNLQGHPSKFAGYTPQNLRGDNNIDNNNNTSRAREVWTPPTKEEVAGFARERGFADPEGFASHWVDYYAQAKWHLANGKPMKDWRKAVITWEPNNKTRNFSAPASRGRSGRDPLDIDLKKYYDEN